MSERITWTLDEQGVAHVRLNRPERLNALDAAMFDAILDTFDRLQAEPKLRAVVLSGEGRGFCAGIDVGNLERIEAAAGGGVDLGRRGGGTQAKLVDRTFGIANGPQQVALGWRQLPVPVIAALHGVVFGGGLQIALGADLRLAAPDTKLSVMEIEWGLVPDMAGMVLMRETLRGDVMRELVLSGRVVAAAQAQQLGLVSRVCDDPLREALAMAAGIAARSPHAVRAAKRLLNQSLQGQGAAELLLAEAREQDALIGSPNQHEAVRAKFAKRAPRFEDPST